MASVNVWRVAGAGGVRVRKNGVLIGDLTPAESSKTFMFNIGETFSFEAYPSEGWEFEKFCADPACATQTIANPFTGTIVAETGNLYVYFRRKRATVNVSVSGSGTVKVYNNNTYIGETKTSKVFNFAVGDIFKFEAVPDTGYAFEKYCSDQACATTTAQNPFTGTITSEAGALLTYFGVSGLKGSVSFSSAPAGADIFLDGQDQGIKTPANLTDIPVGTHTYALKLSGYKVFAGSVQVQENQTAQVSATLEKEGIGTGTLLGIALLGVGTLGVAIYITRR